MNKTDFLAATKCLTMAWYQARQEPPPPDEATRFRTEQARELGAHARRRFLDGTLVDGPNHDALAQTQRLIANDATTTIFEATVAVGAFTATADALRRNGNGWDVFEVKPSFADSTKAAKESVDDLAYTVMVLRRAGVNVKKSALLLLCREYRYGDALDGLFTILDRTADVDARTEKFEADAETFAEAVRAEHVPEPVLNHACRNCRFYKTLCLGSRHTHTVLELPGLSRTGLETLSSVHAIGIADVPPDFELNETQQRVKTAVETGRPFVSPTLGNALAAIEWPCHYLDFETVASTMPLYHGHGCHRQVLTQFSVHHRDSLEAATRHSEFLADAEQSQERLLAEHLIEVLGTQGAIVVYSHFEDVRIKALINDLPELAAPLHAIRKRIVDFEKIIKNHVYHPTFAGSFSLKTVGPVLVPDIGYDKLGVADGDNASAVYARMARGEIKRCRAPPATCLLQDRHVRHGQTARDSGRHGGGTSMAVPRELAVLMQLGDFGWDSGRTPYPGKKARGQRLGLGRRTNESGKVTWSDAGDRSVGPTDLSVYKVGGVDDMQDYDENLEVVRLRISGTSETLQGYNFFWIKAVEGFNPKKHCMECLRGGWKLSELDPISWTV